MRNTKQRNEVLIVSYGRGRGANGEQSAARIKLNNVVLE